MLEPFAGVLEGRCTHEKTSASVGSRLTNHSLLSLDFKFLNQLRLFETSHIHDLISMAQNIPEGKKQSKSFEALTPELSPWILDYTRSMNFLRTTPVQSMAIPLLMGNKDLVVEVGNEFSPISMRSNGAEMSIPGCHRQWQNTCLPYPDRGEIIQGRGPE